MDLKPAMYGCATCHVEYPMGHETSVFIFTRQPWFNHFVTVCPRCKNTYYAWNLTPEQVRYMEFNNKTPGDEVNWSIVEFADDPVVRRFCADTNHKYHVERFIAPREMAHIDANCAMFRFLLERGEMPW